MKLTRLPTRKSARLAISRGGVGLAANDGGCVKTRHKGNFAGPRPPGEVEKIDPVPIWRVDVSPRAAEVEFSHDLDAMVSSVSGPLGGVVAMAARFKVGDRDWPRRTP